MVHLTRILKISIYRYCWCILQAYGFDLHYQRRSSIAFLLPLSSCCELLIIQNFPLNYTKLMNRKQQTTRSEEANYTAPGNPAPANSTAIPLPPFALPSQLPALIAARCAPRNENDLEPVRPTTTDALRAKQVFTKTPERITDSFWSHVVPTRGFRLLEESQCTKMSAVLFKIYLHRSLS